MGVGNGCEKRKDEEDERMTSKIWMSLIHSTNISLSTYYVLVTSQTLYCTVNITYYYDVLVTIKEPTLVHNLLHFNGLDACPPPAPR